MFPGIDGPPDRSRAGTSRSAVRRTLHSIWERMKSGEQLEGEERVYAELMQLHEEYHNTWEFADVLDEHEYDTETGVNPFLHITFDAVVVRQVNEDDPQGIKDVYDKLRRNGDDHLEAIHRIAEVFVTEFYEISHGRRPYTDERYLKQLREL
jgi:hypothetical protein